MTIRLPFRNLEPTFYAGLLDDPLLIIGQRPLGTNLLFDCGQIHHLAKRVLTRLEAIFISHAHMDHWMGIDCITRHLHAASKTVDIFGPPGIADKLSHRLSGYDWNLAETSWGSYRVHEIFRDQIGNFLLSGAEGYRLELQDFTTRSDLTIFQNRLVKVEADTCDHLIESLIFRVNEQPSFLVDEQKLEALGFVKGPWLRELKRRFFQETELEAPLQALRSGPNGPEEVRIIKVAELCRDIGQEQPALAIGYISDVGFTKQNLKRITRLMDGVTLLLCESTFLADGLERARSSFHLCTEDVNEILKILRPRYFLPMHLSKSYSRRTEELYQELNPPSGTTVLKVPAQVTPRPLLPAELSWEG